MEKIIVLSRCISVRREWCDFHFKGFFSGQEIKKITVQNTELFITRNDYILYLEVRRIKGSVLWGKCLKVKNISSD
jgi:hypothetical protein